MLTVNQGVVITRTTVQFYVQCSWYTRVRRVQEEVVAITMNKYRKAHQLLVEAEAGVAQPGVDKRTLMTTSSKGDRSMSVTREITRVVRV